MQKQNVIPLVSAVIAVLVLSACDTSTPSQLHTGKIHIKKEMVVETLDAGKLDPARVNVIADNYTRNSRGDMSLSVSYLAGSAAQELAARIQGDNYKKAFKQRGISNISVVTVPITDKQYAEKVVVAYKALTASAPKDCTRIPGYQGSENITSMDTYEIGCEMQTMMSKMVVDPSDLLGKGGSQDSEGRRIGTIIEPYKAGVPNKPIKGMTASKIGSQ